MLASKDVSPMASCRWVPGSYKELRSLVVPPIFGVATLVTEPRSFDSQSLPGMRHLSHGSCGNGLNDAFT